MNNKLTMADMLIHMKMEDSIDSFLSKYHADSPEDKKVEIADYENDRRKFFTVKQLRDGANELRERRDAINEIKKRYPEL